MFTPEYTITSEILKNTSTIEYCRALIENTPILPHWQKQLQKESRAKFIKASLALEGQSISEDEIKKQLNGFSGQSSDEVSNLLQVLETSISDPDDTEIKNLHKILAGDGVYRRSKSKGNTTPEEILAEVVALFDWYNSLDARDTHPVLVAGLVFAQIERMKPFNSFNFTIAMVLARWCLKSGGYFLNDFLVFEDFFAENQKSYLNSLDSLSGGDFTQWLEYFTDVISRRISNLKEKVLLLARDTKVAKATGRLDLTERQQKIVEFLQDYGILQNKDFARVFPDVSEDSILRDLKTLIDKEIVAKRGSTKSSRYELK